MEIGIIGNGFVGRAVYHELIQNEKNLVRIYDKYDELNNCFDVVSETEICFICVPTPTKKRKQDISAITENLKKLMAIKYNGVVVIKSTITPRHVKEIWKAHYLLKLIVSPEFLDQNKPYDNYSKHVIGTRILDFAQVYTKAFGLNMRDCLIVSAVEAAFVKYVHNCHGAVKVSYFNSIFDACELEGADYRTVINSLLAVNNNVGEKYTRMAVDGRRGFGGFCFPKDSIAFASDYDIATLKGAIENNMKYRKEEMNKCLK